MVKVKLIDACCGAGKTSYMIQKMNQENRRWIYIACYLDEVERIIEACSKRNFKQPRVYQSNNRKVKKSEDLYDLVEAGENIASTHALFKNLTEATVNMLRTQNYTLVLDEIIDIVQPISLGKDVVQAMFDQNYLSKEAIEGSNSDLVKRVKVGQEQRFDETMYLKSNDASYSLKKLKRYAEMDRLVWVNNSMLMWLLPASVFNAFDEIYNLTYLFEGSYQQMYYDLEGISFEPFSVVRNGRQYKLIDYDYDTDVLKRQEIRKLINIYNGKLNGIGDGMKTLSHNWWTKSPDRRKNEAAMKRTLYNYFRNILKSKKAKLMWTCFDANKDKIKGDGNSSCWIPFNQRSTNLYRNKSDLAFLVNRFMKPPIVKYFEAFNYNVNQNMFALSELVQWLFRSALRDDKPVNLFLPSSRMRSLLVDWMNDSLEAKGDVIKL